MSSLRWQAKPCGRLWRAPCLWILLAGCVDDSQPPRPLVAVPDRVAPAQRCIDCHEDIVRRFEQSSHRRTLTRAVRGTAADRFAGRSVELDDGSRFAFRFEGERLVCQTSCTAAATPIGWIFGSGHHARTPLATWPDEHGRIESIEWRVSWYPDGTLASTLGFEGRDGGERSGLWCLGNPQDVFQTRQCFTCHSTVVPEHEGRIDEDGIVPGVSCSRCHFDTTAHASAQNAGTADPIERWSDLAPAEAIARCGECHRRADQFTPQELTPSNRLLVRFAPVGLALSACFRQQDGGPSRRTASPAAKTSVLTPHRNRLDCTSCHDPHAPQQFDRQKALKVCHRCHVREQVDDCPAAPASADCLRCHMPKVTIHPKLRFTDHWIRVHRATPSAPVER